MKTYALASKPNLSSNKNQQKKQTFKASFSPKAKELIKEGMDRIVQKPPFDAAAEMEQLQKTLKDVFAHPLGELSVSIDRRSITHKTYIIAPLGRFIDDLKNGRILKRLDEVSQMIAEKKAKKLTLEETRARQKSGQIYTQITGMLYGE